VTYYPCILNYNVALDDLVAPNDQIWPPPKRRTYRKNYPAWARSLIHRNLETIDGKDFPIHHWWLNPRSKHPDCRKLGTSKDGVVIGKFGYELTREDACNDGFAESVDPLGALLEALGRLNEMNEKQVRYHLWAEIRFIPDPGWPLFDKPSYLL
jgi:hypothetical protein